MNDLNTYLGMDAAEKIVAGFIGGAVYAFYDHKTHPIVIAGSLVTGTAVATFLGDGVVKLLGSYVGAGGSYFIAGVCGTVIIPGIVNASKAWISRWKPPEPPQFGERP